MFSGWGAGGGSLFSFLPSAKEIFKPMIMRDEDKETTDSGYHTMSEDGSIRSSCSEDGYPASITHPATPVTTVNILEYLTDESDVLSDASLTDDEKREKMTSLFIRVASALDVESMKSLLQGDKGRTAWIDVDCRDEEGNTALVYAAALGCDAMVSLLLKNGASVDACDKNGWSPLFWACTNSQTSTARLLIEHGADKNLRSSSGRSIRDLLGKKVNAGNRGIIRVLECTGDGYMDDTESVFGSEWSVYDDESVGIGESEWSIQPEEEEQIPFDWSACPLDQMLVFGSDTLDHILDIAVLKVWLIWLTRHRQRQKQKPFTAANILFLCARYAHHYHGNDLVQELFGRVVDKIIEIVRSNRDDSALLAYWIANSLQLLYYLKRDTHLVLSTLSTQTTLSELITELYNIFIREIESRLLSVLDTALIDFSGTDDEDLSHQRRRQPRSKGSSRGVVFENALLGKMSRRGWDWDWKVPNVNIGMALGVNVTVGGGASGVSSTTSPPKKLRRPRQPATSPVVAKSTLSTTPPTPRTVTTLLTHTLHILQRTQNHPHIINRTFHQLLHFLSTTLFNHILTSRTSSNPLSKSGALQIRLNISHVQDWIRDVGHTYIPSSSVRMEQRLTPIVQLTKILSVLTSLESIDDFLEIKSGVVDGLGFLQLRRVIEGYRYEVGEPTIAADISEYISRMCETLENDDTVPDEETMKATDEEGEEEQDGLANPKRDPCIDLLDPGFMLPFQVPVYMDDDEAGGSGWGMGSPWIEQDVVGFLDEQGVGVTV
ncbi:hypothetical protein SpCBS45565_g02175 [Spizellomyces sp. 'palustris']|nr:hypothetical protein SpCBS45565_g02175 [Spizellomyces sp. 'palustris']